MCHVAKYKMKFIQFNRTGITRQELLYNQFHCVTFSTHNNKKNKKYLFENDCFLFFDYNHNAWPIVGPFFLTVYAYIYINNIASISTHIYIKELTRYDAIKYGVMIYFKIVDTFPAGPTDCTMFHRKMPKTHENRVKIQIEYKANI